MVSLKNAKVSPNLTVAHIVYSYSVLHAMDTKQPPPVGTYSRRVYNAGGK